MLQTAPENEVEVVDLGYNHISDDGVGNLSNLVVDNVTYLCRIKTLVLRGNHISGYGIQRY